ncbi:MAG TPA: Holliday junction branch migration protein RuvA [Dehalococcoidia bacterium]|nr:Holliday junction branch migration protein RuvA [Dehalococcoidia bacterium]
MTFIARLRGTIEEKGRDRVVVDVNGVGYEVSVPGSTLARLGAGGEAVTLRTFTYVREDTIQLFGFLTAEELETFERLLGVTGIGPRGALAFLTEFSPGELAAAVDRQDVTAVARVKGVGRKTAERLVLELRGKLSATPVDGYVPAGAFAGDEAADVLASLGWTSAEIAAALASVPAAGAMPVEERIRFALQKGGRG